MSSGSYPSPIVDCVSPNAPYPEQVAYFTPLTICCPLLFQASIVRWEVQHRWDVILECIVMWTLWTHHGAFVLLGTTVRITLPPALQQDLGVRDGTESRRSAWSKHQVLIMVIMVIACCAFSDVRVQWHKKSTWIQISVVSKTFPATL